MDKTLRMSLLFDFYGALLTDKQRDVFEMYFHEDLSLQEIGEQSSISRQAVHHMLKRTASILETFERKLALLEKHNKEQEVLTKVVRALESLKTRLPEKKEELEALQTALLAL